MANIAINGFGRIGRLVARRMLQEQGLDLVAVNDLTDTKTLAHLFKYDSTHGRFEGSVSAPDEKTMVINGKSIRVFAEKDPKNLPWKDLHIDVVLECTGKFLSKELASLHLQAGAKRVLLSAPPKGDDIKTLVMGVNDASYDPAKDLIVSNASCTTNCLAPMVKVLHENFGLEQGYMTTVHAYTNDQSVLDFTHKDLRRARTAATNIIPTTTGAAKAVAKVMPELKGKLDGIALRVPVQDGSVTDLVCILKKDTTVQEINAAMKKAAAGKLKGILEYCDDPIVSSDIVGNSSSSIFDAQSTSMMGPRFLKVLAWYDNEWGYSCRMVDMLRMMAK